MFIQMNQPPSTHSLFELEENQKERPTGLKYSYSSAR